ncbi:MAG: conjugal transfer protein TraF [Thiotrichales bacterium]|nr:conjugal transfer protein TraF [Thiotrichales bacterium]
MKLKKLSLATLMAMASSTSVFAASNAIPVGSNLGYGDASNKNTIFSMSNNPAWIASDLHQESNYGLGLTAGVRIKQNNFSELNTQYNDRIKTKLEAINSGSNGTALADAEYLKQEINSLILQTRDDFYGQQDVVASLPLVIAHNSFGGIGIELSGSGTAREQILSSNTPVGLKTDYLIANPNANSEDIINNALIIQSALYLKTATYTEGALTYGNSFYSNESGHLSVGLRAKYMQAKLVKSINSLDKYLTASASGNDISDQLNDDFKAHTDIADTETAFGIDLGATWVATNWMAGITFQNINSPSFKFNQLGVGTTDQALTEQFYADQVNLKETVKLDPQARLEASLFSDSRNWTISGSFDVNETNDLVGQPYQWATASASYATEFTSEEWYYALVPDFRIGYRTNLAGDKRSYYTPGLSWGPLNLDLAFSDFSDIEKAVKGDQNDIPEAFMASLGLEFYF